MQNQFGRAQPETPEPRAKGDTAGVSVIGSDITITGNIEASVDLHIEGRVVGDVACATLILGEGSVIDGNIRAERVRISGRVQGSVETKDLAVEATGRLSGDVVYQRLRVTNGGVVEGTLKCKPGEEGSSEAARLKLVEANAQSKPAAIFIE